jgi:hypothetical protein
MYNLSAQTLIASIRVVARSLRVGLEVIGVTILAVLVIPNPQSLQWTGTLRCCLWTAQTFPLLGHWQVIRLRKLDIILSITGYDALVLVRASLPSSPVGCQCGDITKSDPLLTRLFTTLRRGSRCEETIEASRCHSWFFLWLTSEGILRGSMNRR